MNGEKREEEMKEFYYAVQSQQVSPLQNKENLFNQKRKSGMERVIQQSLTSYSLAMTLYSNPLRKCHP